MKKFVAILMVLGLASVVSGAIVPQGNISASAPSSWWEAAGVTTTIDGTGLTGNLHDHGDWDDLWGTGDTTGGEFASVNGINEGAASQGYAYYTFTQSYNIDSLDIWNSWTSTATRSVYIEASNAASPSGTGDWITIYDGDLTTVAGSADYAPSDQIDITDMNARHVAISIHNSYYTPSQLYAFLAEVQFVLVPEPVTLAVLTLGAGLALLRKRRR